MATALTLALSLDPERDLEKQGEGLRAERARFRTLGGAHTSEAEGGASKGVCDVRTARDSGLRAEQRSLRRAQPSAARQSKVSTFDNLVVALGPEAAEKLVAAYGGIRIYVPVRAAPEGPFATLIGHAAAEALSRHYGGERLDMPIAKRAPRVLRGEICRLRRDGMHVTAIARALGCTRRYVFRILADEQH